MSLQSFNSRTPRTTTDVIDFCFVLFCFLVLVLVLVGSATQLFPWFNVLFLLWLDVNLCSPKLIQSAKKQHTKKKTTGPCKGTRNAFSKTSARSEKQKQPTNRPKDRQTDRRTDTDR